MPRREEALFAVDLTEKKHKRAPITDRFSTYISETFLTRSTRQQKVSVLTIAEPLRIAPACHPPAWEAEAESLRSPIRSPSPSLTSSSARLCPGDPKPVTRSSHPPHPGWPVYPAPQERNAASPCPIPAVCLLNMSLSPLSASIPRAHPGRFRRLMLGFKGGMIRQERLDFPPFILTFTDVAGELGYEQVSI